jgi:hypothetical protein
VCILRLQQAPCTIQAWLLLVVVCGWGVGWEFLHDSREVGCEPDTCGCLLCTVCSSRHTIALSACLCACQHPLRGWGRAGFFT